MTRSSIILTWSSSAPDRSCCEARRGTGRAAGSGASERRGIGGERDGGMRVSAGARRNAASDSPAARRVRRAGTSAAADRRGPVRSGVPARVRARGAGRGHSWLGGGAGSSPFSTHVRLERGRHSGPRCVGTGRAMGGFPWPRRSICVCASESARAGGRARGERFLGGGVTEFFVPTPLDFALGRVSCRPSSSSRPPSIPPLRSTAPSSPRVPRPCAAWGGGRGGRGRRLRRRGRRSTGTARRPCSRPTRAPGRGTRCS
jgi:hypothetical protein